MVAVSVTNIGKGIWSTTGANSVNPSGAKQAGGDRDDYHTVDSACSMQYNLFRRKKMANTVTLQARLDPESKRAVEKAAKLRRVGISDYIRLVLVTTAQKEIEQAENQILQMTADEQERFWLALAAPPKLTKPQRKLAKIMKGKK
jgi:uncharacterized protein (DUF1778 family)